MDLKLKGKNVVVTGGSKGIGRSIAIAFAEEGANVATCARTEELLNEVADIIKTKGVFLASDKASFITGSCIVADGGLHKAN